MMEVHSTRTDFYQQLIERCNSIQSRPFSPQLGNHARVTEDNRLVQF